jgi:hypothetical protein
MKHCHGMTESPHLCRSLLRNPQIHSLPCHWLQLQSSCPSRWSRLRRLSPNGTPAEPQNMWTFFMKRKKIIELKNLHAQTETENLPSLRTQILQLALCSRHRVFATHTPTAFHNIHTKSPKWWGFIIVHNNLPSKQIQICPEPVVVEPPWVVVESPASESQSVKLDMLADSPKERVPKTDSMTSCRWLASFLGFRDLFEALNTWAHEIWTLGTYDGYQ